MAMLLVAIIIAIITFFLTLYFSFKLNIVDLPFPLKVIIFVCIWLALFALCFGAFQFFYNLFLAN